jgi:6-phosphogluconolactonase
MSPPQIVVHADPQLLAAAIASRLVTTLVDAQASRGSASVVLTGGGTGIAVLEQLRASAACMAVDWPRVDVFWTDERFLPAGHPERNETQARAALLDHVGVDPARVFAMAASDGPDGDDPDAAAASYADVLAAKSDPEDHGPVPQFDAVLLGMGEEGHVASLFPDSPGVHERARSVVAVRNCPKPPPTRISLTLPTIRHATQVWMCVSGTAKAAAVQLALSGAGELALPAAGAIGQRRTLWLLDRAAASRLPKELLPRLR